MPLLDFFFFPLCYILVLCTNLSFLPSNGTQDSEHCKSKSWKKLVSIAVSGAAGMISNHLLFKVSNLLFYEVLWAANW